MTTQPAPAQHQAAIEAHRRDDGRFGEQPRSEGTSVDLIASAPGTDPTQVRRDDIRAVLLASMSGDVHDNGTDRLTYTDNFGFDYTISNGHEGEWLGASACDVGVDSTKFSMNGRPVDTAAIVPLMQSVVRQSTDIRCFTAVNARIAGTLDSSSDDSDERVVTTIDEYDGEATYRVGDDTVQMSAFISGDPQYRGDPASMEISLSGPDDDGPARFTWLRPHEAIDPASGQPSQTSVYDADGRCLQAWERRGLAAEIRRRGGPDPDILLGLAAGAARERLAGESAPATLAG